MKSTTTIVTTNDQLKDKAEELGICISFDGSRWIASCMGRCIAQESTESLAYSCAIARAEADVFGDSERMDRYVDHLIETKGKFSWTDFVAFV